jgi:hypothetical protein
MRPIRTLDEYRELHRLSLERRRTRRKVASDDGGRRAP